MVDILHSGWYSKGSSKKAVTGCYEVERREERRDEFLEVEYASGVWPRECGC